MSLTGVNQAFEQKVLQVLQPGWGPELSGVGCTPLLFLIAIVCRSSNPGTLSLESV